MVHASASMLHTRLSNQEIVDVLREVIGASGTLVVPTFPAMTSIHYLKRKGDFDARKTLSGMGVLSEIVRKMPSAFRSTHPIKSVAAIGPAAEDICLGHEQCLYPFGVGSPYEKMLSLGVKIVGIGAPMSYLSFVHVAEDLTPEQVARPVWEAGVYEKVCIDLAGLSHVVRTKVHNIALMQHANPEKFCRKYLATRDYVLTRRWLTGFFSVDGQALTRVIGEAMREGSTIYD